MTHLPGRLMPNKMTASATIDHSVNSEQTGRPKRL